MTDFFKYHGLGNDYLVMNPGQFDGMSDSELEPGAIRLICDRHRGIGSDGILWGPLRTPLLPDQPDDAFGLRIYNPDGSEAEKSGNGLRIFAQHIWRRGLAKTEEFRLATIGGVVTARIMGATGSSIAIAMGPVRFDSEAIPMTGENREVLQEELSIGDRTLIVSGANVGNPHCVVLTDSPDEEKARRLGPLIETDPHFPNRTNVQFMEVIDKHRIRIAIWERGAGYTEASGTSSCAAAAVACRLDFCQSPVTVEMAGGNLRVELDENYHATLVGPVASVAEGDFAVEFKQQLGLNRAE